MQRIVLCLAAAFVFVLCLVTAVIFGPFGFNGASVDGPLMRGCDLAAASPDDRARPAGIPGIGVDKIDPGAALSACQAALAEAPENPRLLFQMGRVSEASKDAGKARPFYEKAAGLGYAAAQVRLGGFYENGLGGLARSDLEAARYYKLAADQGHAMAQVLLGAFHEAGLGGLPRNDAEAARLYELAASQGNADGQASLAGFYRDGRGGLPKNAREAVRFFRLAAGQGNADGQAGLGAFHENGLGGVPKNDEEAARLYKLAADQGNALGQNNLGNFLRDGRGGLTKDDNEAARFFKLAADQGNASGQHNLGKFFYDGRGGLTKNDVEAARLFRLSADQGNAWGQISLSVFYHDGLGGLAKDDREAARLLKLAADQGNPYGQFNLAYYYEIGLGGLPQDSEEAARLYKLAADQGVKDPDARAAPSPAAKTAYNYLQGHYTSSGAINYRISTYDNNVCHLRYLFFAEADFNFKYEFDAADIRIESVKSVPAKQDAGQGAGAQGSGFAAIELEAASGKRFRAKGRMKTRANIAPTATSIRLLANAQPDEAITKALVRLATECGAKASASAVAP